MVDRFRVGWSLLRASFRVVGRNKSLLLFPVTTGLLTIVMSILILTPIALQPTGHAYSTEAHWNTVSSRLFVVQPPPPNEPHGKSTVLPTPLGTTIGFGLYFLSMFMATFFNVAFAHAIFNALKGQPVSVTEALGFAVTKVKPIFIWSLFAGLIGYAIKLLEEKFGFVGRWVVRLVGLAWSVASVFVIPVMVLEEDTENPIDLVRRSAGLIKRTWGESIGAYIGLQVIGGVAALSALVFFVPSLGVGIMFNQWAVAAIGISVWLLCLVAFSYASSVASRVYMCVLYLHATTGYLPEGFTADMMTTAWKVKKA